MSDLPKIGSLPSTVQREVRAAFDSIKAWLRRLDSKGGVVDAGSLSTAIDREVSTAIDREVDGIFRGSVPASYGALTGFTATGLFNSIMVEWEAVDYYGGHVEIWRSTTNDIGTASLIGTTQATLYVDTPPDSSTSVTYYYWGRIVSVSPITGRIEGPFNATAGTPAATANDPSYVLEILTGQVTESQLYGDLASRIDHIDTPVTGLLARVGNTETDIDALQGEINNLTLSDFDSAAAYSVDDIFRYGSTIYKVISVPTPPNPTPPNATYYGVIGEFASLSDMVSVNAIAVSDLGVRVTDNEGDISSIATSVSGLQTTVGGHTTTLTEQSSSLDGLEAQYTVKIDNNGYPAGFGLASSPVNGTPFSEFIALADRYAIVNPNTTPAVISTLTNSGGTATAVTASRHGLTTGDTVVISCAEQGEYNGSHKVAVVNATRFTFIVSGTPASPATVATGFDNILFGKAAVPFIVQGGNVYLSSALIKAATINTAMIQDAAIDNAKIANLSAAKLLAGIITAANIYLGSSAKVHLDGANQRITVHDGTRYRVILGKIGTAEWGISIYDAAGNTVMNSGGITADMVRGLTGFATLDKISAANISTYIAGAAITNAYIADANISTLKIAGAAITAPAGIIRTTDTAWTYHSSTVSVMTTPTIVIPSMGVSSMSIYWILSLKIERESKIYSSGTIKVYRSDVLLKTYPILGNIKIDNMDYEQQPQYQDYIIPYLHTISVPSSFNYSVTITATHSNYDIKALADSSFFAIGFKR